MKLSKILCALALLVLLMNGISGVLAQQALPQGIRKTASVEGITEYTLPNGLRVLLFPDESNETITVNITYLVGSRHENYGETGMAHLLEHLVFKGTPKHPNIPAELSAHGAAPNGTTYFDRTNYYETFPASDANLEWALDLEADRMINSYIAEKDLKSEFSVVRNELESGENNPFGVLSARVASTAYIWHNYGNTTIGARSDVENVPIDRLQAFYKKYYQPDNAVLTVAGNFDEAKTLALIARLFGAIPKPARALAPAYTVEPAQDGARFVTVSRAGDIQIAMAGYHTPSGAHPDYAALSVMNNILTAAPSGRLYRSLVETKKASDIDLLTAPYKEPGYTIYMAATGKDKSIEDLRRAAVETLESFAAAPPALEEVERAKNEAAKNFETALSSSQYLALALTDWIGRGDWRLMFVNRDRVAQVTPQDVQRVAKKYLIESNRTVGLFVPTDNSLRAEIPRVSDTEIAAVAEKYKGGAPVSRGEAFDPSPKNIEARTSRADLDNLKIALLPKQTRGDTVNATIYLRWGNEKNLANRQIAANITAQMLMRGTSKHTRQQLKDEFSRLKSEVYVDGTTNGLNVSVQTTHQISRKC